MQKFWLILIAIIMTIGLAACTLPDALATPTAAALITPTTPPVATSAPSAAPTSVPATATLPPLRHPGADRRARHRHLPAGDHRHQKTPGNGRAHRSYRRHQGALGSRSPA